MKYDDNSLMPFGEHRDKPLKDVPAWRLLYFHGQMLPEREKLWGHRKLLFDYIEDNLDVLDKER